MRKSLATALAAAVLLAGAGLAAAQNVPGGTNKIMQNHHQDQAGVATKHHYGSHAWMQSTPKIEGRSAAKPAKRHGYSHYGSHAWMQGKAQGRSAAGGEQKTQPSSQPKANPSRGQAAGKGQQPY